MDDGGCEVAEDGERGDGVLNGERAEGVMSVCSQRK